MTMRLRKLGCAVLLTLGVGGLLAWGCRSAASVEASDEAATSEIRKLRGRPGIRRAVAMLAGRRPGAEPTAGDQEREGGSHSVAAACSP